MAKFELNYMSLSILSGNDDSVLASRLKEFLIACARFLGSYQGQNLALSQRMNMREAIVSFAKNLELNAIEISSPLGGLPVLAFSRVDPELVLLLPSGPDYFLASGSHKKPRLIHVGQINKHYRECIQLFRRDLPPDINHQIINIFPIAFAVVGSFFKILLLASSLIFCILMLFANNFNIYLLLLSAVLALIFALAVDIFLRNLWLRNIPLVHLWSLSQVYARVFKLDLERYNKTTWSHIQSLCASVYQNGSEFMTKSSGYILALAIIISNIFGLYVLDKRAALMLFIILGSVLSLAYFAQRRLKRLDARIELARNKLDKSLSALNSCFSMALGLKAQGPLLLRIAELNQELSSQIANARYLRLKVLAIATLGIVFVLIFIIMLFISSNLKIILFFVLNNIILYFAILKIVKFFLRPQCLVFTNKIKSELSELELKSGERVAPVHISGLIETHDLSFAYPEAGFLIIKNASLRIEAQKFYALIGPSGSGKSTLVKLLSAQEIAHDGQVVFDGQDVRSLELEPLRQHFGVVNQDSRTFAGSIRSNIIGGRDINNRDLERLLYSHQIFDLLLDLPMSLETYIFEPAANISRLQVVIILLARALVHQPKVIFLDEIFKGVPPDQIFSLADFINNLKLTRILVTHNLVKELKPDFIFDQNMWCQKQSS